MMCHVSRHVHKHSKDFADAVREDTEQSNRGNEGGEKCNGMHFNELEVIAVSLAVLLVCFCLDYKLRRIRFHSGGTVCAVKIFQLNCQTKC